MSYSTGNLNDSFSPSGELVPAEVNARVKQEGREFLRTPPTSGATVDREGFFNNYALVPQMSYAAGDTPKKQQRLGSLYAVATWGLIAIAFAVTYLHS